MAFVTTLLNFEEDQYRTHSDTIYAHFALAKNTPSLFLKQVEDDYPVHVKFHQIEKFSNLQ